MLYTWPAGLLACDDDDDDADDDIGLYDIHQVEIYVSRCRNG